jgi:MORN repeat variant.
MPKYKKIPDNENAIELDGKVVMSFDPRYKEYLKWRNENPELEKELQEELDKDLTVDRLYNNGAPHKEVSPLSELLTYNIEIWTWYDEDGKLKLKSEIQDEEHHGKTWEYFSNGTLKSEIN